MEILAYGFVQRALIAGLLISVACSVLGVFLVLRRDAMLGHGLAEVAFGGVALGLLVHVLPLLAAAVVAAAGALVMMKLKEKAGVHGDTAIGIVASAGMAAGILIVSLAGGFNVYLFGYVFGNVLAIKRSEVGLAAFLAIVVLGTVIRFYHEFFYITFDEDAARVSGVRVGLFNGILAVLSALTVVLAMKVVGILLVAAMIIIPAAAALQVARSFRQAIWASALISMGTALAGLLGAVFLDLPPAGTIVLLSTLVFGLFIGIRRPFGPVF